MEKLELIKGKIIKPLEELNIFVTDISYHTEGKYNFLTIELDKHHLYLFGKCFSFDTI